MCNLVSFGAVPVLLVYLVSCCKKGGKYRKLLTIKVSRECWTVQQLGLYIWSKDQQWKTYIQTWTLSYSVQEFVREACKAEVLCTLSKKIWVLVDQCCLHFFSVSIKSNQIGLTLKFLHLSLFPIAIRLYHKNHNILQSLFICTHNMLGSSWMPPKRMNTTCS